MNRILVIVLAIIAACGPTKPDKEYVTEIESWKVDRLKNLKGENGYVNLAGLFWLKDGVNTFGGLESNDLVFPPDKSPETIGSFNLKNDTVTMILTDNHGITSNGDEERVKKAKSIIINTILATLILLAAYTFLLDLATII